MNQVGDLADINRLIETAAPTVRLFKRRTARGVPRSLAPQLSLGAMIEVVVGLKEPLS